MSARTKKLLERGSLTGFLRRFPKVRKALIRISVLLLVSLAVGLGYSALNTEEYLPTLDGNAYSVLAGENVLYMVLSSEQNNCLVRTDYTGRLLNYSTTEASRGYQYLEADGETVYAILNDYEVREDFCGNVQSLAELSLKRSSMRPRILLNLEELKGVPEGIFWREVYVPGEGEETVRLTGIDRSGQGYLLRYEPKEGRLEIEKVLEGESLFALKYVSEGRLVWIGRNGRAGQVVDGERQQDVLRGLASAPSHISTCGTRCFLSDSVSGDIFELYEDGSVRLYRRGGDMIGETGYQYGQLEIFTTYQEDGAVHVIGLCAAEDGMGSAVAGETRSVHSLSAGPLRLLMLWEQGRHLAGGTFLVLLVLSELIRLIFHSPRLAVRLAVGEIFAALLLIGTLTRVELNFFEETIRKDAGQRLQMVVRNLVSALSAQTGTDAGQTAGTVEAVRAEFTKIMGADDFYTVNVFWQTPQGAAVGYDAEAPAGCLAEDVKNRSFCRLVESTLERGHGGDGGVEAVQNANYTDLVHAAVFTLDGKTGCAVVCQSVESLLAERMSFLNALATVLLICPAIFLVLILMTRRLLRPLGEVRRALEEFYASGGGNRIQLARMPRTELYEVGRVFNELSVQTRVQFNKLSTINGAYVRLVPDCLLRMLGKEDVQALSAGDFAALDGAMLMFLPERPARSAERLERFLEPAARQIQAFEGMLVDYDEGLGALAALFQDPEKAKACARAYLTDRGEEGGVTAAVFSDRVEAGVFGSEKLMIPLAVSQNLHRKQQVLERLGSFGAVLVQAGDGDSNLRLLGWDGELAYREDPSCRPGAWQSCWRSAAPLWERGMEEFQRGEFAGAMRTFTQVLRVLPGDGAARWYLFRCAALRDGKDPAPDLGLLYDWRDERG